MTRKSYYFLVAVTRLSSDAPLLWMFYFLYFPRLGSGGAGDAVWNGIFFAAFAGLHSLFAREAPKRIVARLVGPAFVRIAYVVLSGVTLALLLHLWRPVSGELWHTSGYASGLLTVAYAASVLALIRIPSYFDYLDFLGLRQIARSLAGEPASPTALSVKGPYAYCRHPMYLAMLAVFWVGPAMSYTRLEFALLGTLYLFVGLVFEEGNLRRELGAAYDLYSANVPMLIPRLTPWHYHE